MKAAAVRADSKGASQPAPSAEQRRLAEDEQRKKNWKRWGPYLSERQWGTVREDYSADGRCWAYFPHDHARSRRYRWGEDGLLGIADRECRLCFALALWNGRDPILKERLFGLVPGEGNHGEDVKEYCFYLDSTPTHSYLKALYKYPQAEYPYDELVRVNRGRDRTQGEYELLDTGVFDDSRYFDVFAEYAKASPDDILIRLSVANRGPEAAEIDLLACLWFRNTWASGSPFEDWGRPKITQPADRELLAEHSSLGRFRLVAAPRGDGEGPELLFTNNETNARRLFGQPNVSPYVKDAFHDYVIHGRKEAVNGDRTGTKAAAHYRLRVDPGQTAVVRLRLFDDSQAPADPLGDGFRRTFQRRTAEADEFYAEVIGPDLSSEARRVTRQAYAGLLWTKQFYYYVVKEWLEGDPNGPPPPEQRRTGRNHHWTHVFDRDVLSVPDKWEFPWYAAWDLAFQMLPMSRLDGDFARKQLLLLLREWYMHPNGQLPAYEFSFSDVNPPVHAWACWKAYQATDGRGRRDRAFLERTFQKLLLNFTWWVNREDVQGNQVFAGGFLGMDNVGVFDRGQPLPPGEYLEQADGTAWMAFYCLCMLAMALELAEENPAYEDAASKFLNHFTAISDAMNAVGGTGLWDEEDGFYYDLLNISGTPVRLRARSLVGLIPLISVAVLDDEALKRLSGFYDRMQWFLANRKDLAQHISYLCPGEGHCLRLLAVPSRQRLHRMLRHVLDVDEFLSPYGIRSLSRYYKDHPYTARLCNRDHQISYEPGESTTDLFGGNSNWRGPVWMPINFLLVEALGLYHRFYGDSFQVECPTGSGRMMNLRQVACEIHSRLARLFVSDGDTPAAWPGDRKVFREDPHWKDLLLFNEYFHGDTGRGCGASHQTGWTSLIATVLAQTGP